MTGEPVIADLRRSGDGIFEEKATAGDNGEHEIAVCGKFNKFNLKICLKKLCDECTQWFSLLQDSKKETEQHNNYCFHECQSS